jgi:hypothetical protein
MANIGMSIVISFPTRLFPESSECWDDTWIQCIACLVRWHSLPQVCPATTSQSSHLLVHDMLMMTK